MREDLVVHSSGMVHYPNVHGFEEDGEFQLGIEGQAKYVMFPNFSVIHYEYPFFYDRGGWGPSVRPQAFVYEPSYNLVYSGSRSAKLSLLDPSEEVKRRLEILHDWDPLKDVHIWVEAWYYFPEELYPFDSNQGLCFHRAIYERMWDGSLPYYYQKFQISIGVWPDGRSASYGEHMFLLDLNHGEVDNNNDGINDLQPKRDLYSNDPVYKYQEGDPYNPLVKVWVPFGRWFKVATYVYRNLTDFDNGIIKVWIDDTLIWDLEGVRTVGIEPNTIASCYPGGEDPRAWLSSGFSLYRPIGVPPSTIYVDQVALLGKDQT